MKTTAKIAGLLLMILLASGVTLNAQRGMRGNGMNGMRYGMGPGPMAEMRRGSGLNDRNGWGPMSSGRLINESLPNVTEKQKKDLADLQVKQQEEMKKLREETSAKMQSMRDSHKKAMENLLTDEQKKFIESKQVKPAVAPAPVAAPAK